MTGVIMLVVKWTRYLFSTTIEAEKRDPGNEVVFKFADRNFLKTEIGVVIQYF